MLNLVSLDSEIRELMLAEAADDIRSGRLFISPRLTAAGAREYPEILLDAIRQHDDDWMTDELARRGLIKQFEERRKANGGASIVKVPHTASQTIAEGEFNRYYIRAICISTMSQGLDFVEVYRAKQVQIPRPESQRRIGAQIHAQSLLADLRANSGVETALGVPGGPNSGLSVRSAKAIS